MLWPYLVTNARLRAQPTQLHHGASDAVVRALEIAGKPGKPDAELAQWVLSENGGGLRDRWTRRLEEAVGEVVGPIWEAMDAAEADDIAAAGCDGVVIDSFERLAFRVEELVGEVLDSPVLLPAFAALVRTSIAKRTEELSDGTELYQRSTHLDLPIWGLGYTSQWATRLKGHQPGFAPGLHSADRSREMTIVALWEWLGGYLDALQTESPGPGWERVARIEGGHRPDGSKAPDLWIHRPTGPARYLVTFAGSLWESEWRDEAEAFYRRRVPAMPRAVVATFADVARGEMVPSDREAGVFVLQSAYQPRQTSFSFYPVTIAPEAIVALPALLNRAGPRRLLRELSRRSWRQFQAQADAAHIITFLGGWQALADELKTHPGDMKHVREVAKLLSGCSWTLPSIGAEGFGLWNFSYKRGSRSGPGRIRFELADILTPGGVARLTGNSPTQRAARHLIPVPMQDPVTVGRPNEAGSELILQDLVLMRFRSHAEDYLRHDGVHLPWIELANRAGLASSAVPRIVDAWCDPSDGWLMRSGSGATARFQVADSEMDGFIRDGARLQMQGRENQRRAREQRNSRHRKH